jgi:hypothetical protein
MLPIDPATAPATRSHTGHPAAADQALRAIGAQVMLHLPDGGKVVAQVDGGNGHSGKRSADIQLGLGKLPAGTPLTADITWRDRAGRIHRESIKVMPGWQTIILGSSQPAGVQA